MQITSLLGKFIVEQSRFQVLYDKVVKPKDPKDPKSKGLMTFDILKALIFADPTTKAPENFDVEGASIEDMDKVKAGKFVQWILKNYLTFKPSEGGLPDDIDVKSKEYQNAKKEYLRLFMEDLFKVTDDLKKFERFKQYFPEDKRDINKFTVKSLFDFLETFELPENVKKKLEKSQTKKEIRKERKGYSHPGAEIMLVGDEYTLIKIEGTGEKQKEAASWYGGYYDYDKGESRWCTSPPNSSHFMHYASKGPLYVILANDDKGKVGERTGLPQERYQFHFPDSQFMDRADRQINLVDFLNNKAPELKEIFKPEFAKGLVTKGGNKVQIDYPNSAAGKFIALYGFEDLFESLPETVEHIVITVTGSDSVAFDVPESLGRFTNLRALLLQNCVKSLPESIGKLKKLHILSLPDNKQIETLPVSIIDIPDLTFINLKGSNPNLIMPPALAERAVDQQDQLYYLT